MSPQRVTLAWMLAKAPVVIPILGARRPESITDSAHAADLVLTPRSWSGWTRPEEPAPEGLSVSAHAHQATYGVPDSLAMGRWPACQPIIPSATFLASHPACASAWAA